MKIKKNFVLRQVAGTWVILPLDDKNINFTDMMTVNDSGAMLWKLLEQGAEEDDLVNALLAEYNVSAQQAREDVREFADRLMKAGCLESC